MEETQQTVTTEKVHRYRCPACGAELLFEPKDGCLVCPYCGRSEAIMPGGGGVGEHSYEEYLQLHAGQLTVLARGALEVKCDSCGATVTFTPPEVAGECDFCGSKIVAQPKAADPVVAPEGVLPFKVTQAQTSEMLKKWLSSLWFAPNALKKFAMQDAINGVYIPYWTYDAHTVSNYAGERGEHYYVTETYTTTNAQGRTETRTRQVRHTRWYSASGTVSRWFDDILVPGTKSLPPDRIVALEPWDLDQMQSYEPAYLAGYRAQRYQVDLPEGFELAKKRAEKVIDADVRRDIGGDEQRVHNITTQYSAITFKHLLLPIYVGAYRFNQKVYQIVINGRTGEVQGDRPFSFWKIFFFVLFLLFLTILIIFVFQSR